MLRETKEITFRARLHETRSEIKPVWNLEPLWNVVPFTWQFKRRFHCGNFPRNNKTLLHMCNRCCAIDCFLNNSSKSHAHYLATLRVCATLLHCEHLLFTWKSQCGLKFHFCQFDWSEICTEVSFAPPEVMRTLIMKLPHTEVNFYPEVKSQTGLS